MKAVDEKVGKFIGNSDTVFIIPPFQRNYSWEEEQCCELFDDILNSVRKGKEHYIGNIVYYVGENDRAGFNEYILIDGQQRITSILLLLCAIRSKLPQDEVKRLEKIFFTDSEINKLGFNNNEIDPNLLQSGEGVFADLVIFPKFVDFQSSSLLAIGKPEIFDSITNRPIGAILSINKYIPSISNSQSYFESVIIHQLTHILGFMYDLFDKFTIGFSNVIKTDIETRTNKIKKFIISPKVVAYAKKYFNCENMTGVELEDKGGYDDYNNSHWEARILLGEYMNSEVHTPEQAISGFTLALLEDSGWYETNNYTGGLMRFGKHQGCSFLNEDCELIDSSKNKFKNDLFAVPSIPEILKNTCSSGRQSRCYITINIKSNRGIYIAGKEIADDCFVSDYKREEEDLSYYVGSCSKGNGGYGTIIYYNNDIQRKNGDIPENFGEKISNNSFCVLSSAVPLSLKDENINEYNLYDGITHPMCYPMFCTSRSLTIQIYDHYIVCPREGGIVELKGNYKGYIYCPDYNLICTGTVMCNDMFDCIEKHSLEKDDNFNYDYEIKTSQDKIKDESLTENEITIGYELTNEDSGKCPQFCRQCKENKKCFLCMDNYILIGTREGDNNPIYCVQNIDLGKYYKNDEDNTYYLCSDNCLSCSAKDHCNSCDSMYKLNSDNSACNEIVPNCKVLDSNNEKCEECKENFYFLDDDKYHCYNDSLDKEKFFTEDDGKTYINCSKVIEKCDVYSFGVVALEILMGRHPTELLTSLSSSSSQNMMLHEILDQRLPPPNHLVAQDIFLVATIAFACLHEKPKSRPTMKYVSQEFLSQKKPIAKPLQTFSL